MLAKVRFWNGSPRVRTARIERKEFKLAFFFVSRKATRGVFGFKRPNSPAETLLATSADRSPAARWTT